MRGLIWRGAALMRRPLRVFASAMRPDSGFLLRDALRREFDEELLRESGLFSWKEEGRSQVSAISAQEAARLSASSCQHQRRAQAREP